MKDYNKRVYNNIMKRASKVVKKLIESGAKYSEITRVVNEMAVVNPQNLPNKIMRNVDDLWSKMPPTGVNKDVNNPDWINLTDTKFKNLKKYKDCDKAQGPATTDDYRENCKQFYVYALERCGYSDQFPQTLEEAEDLNVMMNVLHEFIRLGGTFNEIIDCFAKHGGFNGNPFATRSRKNKNDGADSSSDEVVPKRKRIKAQSLPAKERYFDIDKKTEKIKYKEIPYLDGFDSLNDIVDVIATEEDQKIAREAEERLANGDNDVLNNSEEITPEIAAEIARDEQYDNDIKQDEVVIATTIEEPEINSDAAEEIQQAEEKIESAEELDDEVDTDEDISNNDDYPDYDEVDADDNIADYPDYDEVDSDEDIFNPDYVDPEDEDINNNDEVDADDNTADYPDYDEVDADDTDEELFDPDYVDPEDEDINNNDDFDSELHNNDSKVSDDINDEYEDEELFDPDYVDPEDEQPETPKVQPQQVSRSNSIRRGNILSGNLEEYSNPAMNKIYAENYDDTLFTLNNKGEIGADFEIFDFDTSKVIDTYTVYRDTVKDLFNLHLIGCELNIECGELAIRIRFKNKLFKTKIVNVYINAQDEVNVNWMDSILDAASIISHLADENQIFNSVDEVHQWLDEKGEVKILNNVD